MIRAGHRTTFLEMSVWLSSLHFKPNWTHSLTKAFHLGEIKARRRTFFLEYKPSHKRKSFDRLCFWLDSSRGREDPCRSPVWLLLDVKCYQKDEWSAQKWLLKWKMVGELLWNSTLVWPRFLLNIKGGFASRNPSSFASPDFARPKRAWASKNIFLSILLRLADSFLFNFNYQWVRDHSLLLILSDTGQGEEVYPI